LGGGGRGPHTKPPHPQSPKSLFIKK